MLREFVPAIVSSNNKYSNINEKKKTAEFGNIAKYSPNWLNPLIY